MAIAKKIKVLKVINDRGNLGRSYNYITAVTEKVIKTVCNEICESYHDRKDGGPYGRANRSIGCGYLRPLNKLEEYISKNGKEKSGVKVWNGGFKLRYNSRREVVNEKCIPMNGSLSYDEWFKKMDVEVIDLTR